MLPLSVKCWQTCGIMFLYRLLIIAFFFSSSRQMNWTIDKYDLQTIFPRSRQNNFWRFCSYHCIHLQNIYYFLFLLWREMLYHSHIPTAYLSVPYRSDQKPLSSFITVFMLNKGRGIIVCWQFIFFQMGSVRRSNAAKLLVQYGRFLLGLANFARI